MQILFISQSAPPSIGGVQKHIAGVVTELSKKNLTKQNRAKQNLQIDLIAIDHWRIPPIKFLGLLMIWGRLLREWHKINKADVIFIHDVFIYFLPWRILLPHKKIITIFHGFEKKFPIPYKNILYKRLAARLSKFTLSIGSYINKYYGLPQKNNTTSYGGVTVPEATTKSKLRNPKQFTYLGRLEKDTGLAIFLAFFDILKDKQVNFSVDFLGDGPLSDDCQKYGPTRGFVAPEQYLNKSSFCFASGYMSILEALSYENICLTAYNNQLKKDYLCDSPFANAIIIAANAADLFSRYQQVTQQPSLAAAMRHDGLQIAKQHSFQKLAKLYLDYIYE